MESNGKEWAISQDKSQRDFYTHIRKKAGPLDGAGYTVADVKEAIAAWVRAQEAWQVSAEE